MTLAELKKEVRKVADPEKAKGLARFFKTGKGQYGHGDLFWGITVPISRTIARKYKDLSMRDVGALLLSKYHEERLIAVLLLVHNFEKGDEKKKKEVYDFYLKHTKLINNWDLVDLSAPKIVGEYLLGRPRTVLYKLAKSYNLWERRIAIIATFQLIYYKEWQDTFKIGEILLHDKHDLIHKAVGWMLREVGKRISPKIEMEFLDRHARTMPRTMLRYAIEHFSPVMRKKYLGMKNG